LTGIGPPSILFAGPRTSFRNAEAIPGPLALVGAERVRYFPGKVDAVLLSFFLSSDWITPFLPFFALLCDGLRPSALEDALPSWTPGSFVIAFDQSCFFLSSQLEKAGISFLPFFVLLATCFYQLAPLCLSLSRRSFLQVPDFASHSSSCRTLST